jgi:hypothetical protein
MSNLLVLFLRHAWVRRPDGALRWTVGPMFGPHLLLRAYSSAYAVVQD